MGKHTSQSRQFSHLCREKLPMHMSLDLDQRKHRNALETHESPLIWINLMHFKQALVLEASTYLKLFPLTASNHVSVSITKLPEKKVKLPMHLTE